MPEPSVSGSRATVLAALRQQSAPRTLAALSQDTSLHVNTLREHLEVLESDGWVRRHRATPSGRGRPAWLYEATVPSARPGISGYAALAAALAATIVARSPDPRAQGIEAGEGWGRALGEARGAPDGPLTAAARHQVVTVLTDLGFAPESLAGGTAVRLTRCPLLDAARIHPEVVCGVHLGIVRGALRQWGAPSQEVELLPFSEPGACRLLMPAATGLAPATS